MSEPEVFCGLDLATRLAGYCYGNGSAVPVAGAWRFPHVDDDLGLLGQLLWNELDVLRTRHKVRRFIYEAPIMKPTDKLLVVRKIYGMGFLVETYCRVYGLGYCEEPVKSLKKELGGHRHAEKADMVFAAEKCGVTLPELDADGRKDAADAFAAWLIGVRHYAKQFQPAWDRRLYSSRGALL